MITGLPQGGGERYFWPSWAKGFRGCWGGLVSLCQVVADFVAEEELVQATGGDAEAIKEAIA